MKNRLSKQCPALRKNTLADCFSSHVVTGLFYWRHDMKDHPIANIFPLLPEQELEGLASDIEKRGLLEPIVIHEDMILDGRNRYRACVKAGVTPHFRTYGGDDALADVVSWNLVRRHLNESQRSMVAAKLLPLYEAQAKERQVEQAKRNQPQSQKVANLPPIEKSKARDKAAAAVKVSGRSVQDAKAILRDAPEQVKAIESGAKTIHEVKREIARAKSMEAHRRKLTEPEQVSESGSFQLVLADPPWRYDVQETPNRRVENHYPTADLNTIKGHAPNTEKDAVLFLWATAPKLAEAVDVLAAWGFRYVTCAVWDKKKIGMGYWFRGRHELLLVGVKGKPGTTPECERVASVFEEPRGAHSAKPECVYQWIEQAFPDKTKLEMYARKPRKGWVAWGNES
jgi:N6-adenosine-specific RNA methylase IME4